MTKQEQAVVRAAMRVLREWRKKKEDTNATR